MSSRLPLLEKTEQIDFYFDCFFLCGLNIKQIAEKCAVTPKAVENALKRYDKAAYKMERNRRKEENRIKHHANKYTDRALEQARMRMDLFRNQKDAYINVVRRILHNREVVILLRHAADILELCADATMSQENKYRRMLMLYLPESKVKHPVAQQAKNIEKTTGSEVIGRASYETTFIKGSYAGVPGVGILGISKALNTDDIKKAYQLAQEAVLTAGWVNPTATVKDILEGRARIYHYWELESLCENIIDEARSMPTISDPIPMAELPKEGKNQIVKQWLARAKQLEKGSPGTNHAGTGKRGKQGGMRSIEKGITSSIY